MDCNILNIKAINCVFITILNPTTLDTGLCRHHETTLNKTVLTPQDHSK